MQTGLASAEPGAVAQRLAPAVESAVESALTGRRLAQTEVGCVWKVGLCVALRNGGVAVRALSCAWMWQLFARNTGLAMHRSCRTATRVLLHHQHASPMPRLPLLPCLPATCRPARPPLKPSPLAPLPPPPPCSRCLVWCPPLRPRPRDAA